MGRASVALGAPDSSSGIMDGSASEFYLCLEEPNGDASFGADRIGSVLPTSAASTETSAPRSPTEARGSNYSAALVSASARATSSFRMLLLSNAAEVSQRYASRKGDGSMIQATTDPKVRTEHLRRQAVVYIRQSSAHQIRSNHESSQRQYALAERARALGWSHAPSKRLTEIKDVTARVLFTVIVSKPYRPRSQTGKWAFCFLWKHRAWLVRTRIGIDWSRSV